MLDKLLFRHGASIRGLRPNRILLGFISIKVAKFLHWLVVPNTTLLLYKGLRPAMLGHQRRPTIGGVTNKTMPILIVYLTSINFKGTIVCWTSKLMVLYWQTTTLEHFTTRHSGSVKLGHKTPRTGCSRLRREKISFWTSSAPEPQLVPPLSLSLTRGPHLSSSSSSSSLHPLVELPSPLVVLAPPPLLSLC